MGRLIDLTGNTFGRLSVLDRDRGGGKRREPYWICICSCGEITTVRGSHLRSGNTLSCGCYNRAKARETKTKHGLSQGNPLYKVWTNMKTRCYNGGDKWYVRYGGRGIKVCDEWRESPEVFCKWTKENGWEPGLHIDRIDNDGDYGPSNCRFVTPRKSMENREVSLARKLPVGIMVNKTGGFSFTVQVSGFESADAAEEARTEVLKHLGVPSED